MCLLSDDIYEYNFVSQGKISIAGVDDAEEMSLTDVSSYPPDIHLVSFPPYPLQQSNFLEIP